MLAPFKRFYNTIRLFLKEQFTNRVKRIEIKDQKGKKHKVTVEQKVEKVCTHSKIEEIAPTLWECMDCRNAFYQINYKALVTLPELLDYLEKIKNHLGRDNDY